MDRIKINSVEELLSVPETVKCVEISQNEISRYIYSNRYNLEEEIDLQELRNIFAKSINKSYKNKKYSQNVVLSQTDIKNVCYG